MSHNAGVPIRLGAEIHLMRSRLILDVCERYAKVVQYVRHSHRWCAGYTTAIRGLSSQGARSQAARGVRLARAPALDGERGHPKVVEWGAARSMCMGFRVTGAEGRRTSEQACHRV